MALRREQLTSEAVRGSRVETSVKCASCEKRVVMRVDLTGEDFQRLTREEPWDEETDFLYLDAHDRAVLKHGVCQDCGKEMGLGEEFEGEGDVDGAQEE